MVRYFEAGLGRSLCRFRSTISSVCFFWVSIYPPGFCLCPLPYIVLYNHVVLHVFLSFITTRWALEGENLFFSGMGVPDPTPSPPTPSWGVTGGVAGDAVFAGVRL
jgi:hypothetical protein